MRLKKSVSGLTWWLLITLIRSRSASGVFGSMSNNWNQKEEKIGKCVSEWLSLIHWPLGDLKKNLRKVIFKLILMIFGWGIFCKIALKWMSMDLTDDKSTLVQAMAWCHQATSHYLSQCWPRSMPPNGVTRPQWVNSLLGTADIRVHISCVIITYTLGRTVHWWHSAKLPYLHC